MHTAIVAIGGGLIRTRGTVAIDREIIRLSGKKHPRLLFVPTASSDAERYCTRIENYFGKCLKCRTDCLLLMRERLSKQQIRGKIMSADIIYVGGGNTLQMMRIWRRLGVDRLLRAAYKKGIVLSGISAGAICWFESGHSDSMSFYDPKKWKYINVKGLGLVPGVFCPHYNSMTRGVPRRRGFREMIGRMGVTGIAAENNCAVVVTDGKFCRLVQSKSYARAYRVFVRRGEVVARQITASESRIPLQSLYARQ